MFDEEKNKEAFKEQCVQYLGRLSVMELRCYGRFLNLPAPTYLKKADLICEIVEVLCEERRPTRNKRGAPIKNVYFSTDILVNIERIRKEAYGQPVQVVDGDKEKGKGVVVHFSVCVDALNNRQKQLLNDFLNSL